MRRRKLTKTIDMIQDGDVDGGGGGGVVEAEPEVRKVDDEAGG